MRRAIFEDDVIKLLDKGWKSGMYPATSDIHALPSAQPEPQWILCSERMPEEHEWIGSSTVCGAVSTVSDEVYVTFKEPKGKRFCRHLSFCDGKLSKFNQQEIDVFHPGSVPVAWKPLPEPYKGGEKDAAD